MSPWDLIGWLIALPLVALSFLFTFAILYAIVKQASKQPKTDEPKRRHLRILDDNEPA